MGVFVVLFFFFSFWIGLGYACNVEEDIGTLYYYLQKLYTTSCIVRVNARRSWSIWNGRRQICSHCYDLVVQNMIDPFPL